MPSREFNIRKWQTIISDYKKSSLSLKSYCFSKNVSLRGFYYWRRKLSLSENKKEEKSFSELSFRDEILKAEASEKKAVHSSGIHINIGRFHLSVESNFDTVEFRRTVEVLMALSC